ncbi:MAG TPA: YbhB/YbcL family Raf kinase inhibitor-like protein [Phycisphaerales bacterium]|nr:YbhB/YbcL family Raf kinase inhibitor-like protein [Phycisphaerales bacterium]
MKHTTVAVLLAALAAGSLALAQPAPKQPEKKSEPQPKQNDPAKAPAQKDAPKDTPSSQPTDKPTPNPKTDDKKPDTKKSGLKLTSPSIEHDKQMPKKHTVDGDPADPTKKHISPALKWEGAPAETKEFALVMFDPDAGNFVHWVVYKIPADVKELPEGLPNGKDNAELTTPVKITQGTSSFRQIGYLGPAARKGAGVHHYNFKLYALDKTLDLKPGATRKELEEAMKGHVIAEAVLIGTNER